ncbi:MAG: PorP/SprF family type IX secretion system membrane protein, partial [Bacteroidia bacterium]|nr:PorP/SprF family type IX secretion system membrane protein [Bacteroidia bacterium]
MKTFILFTTSFFLSGFLFPQSPVFNANNKTGQLLINPAFAGTSRCPHLGSNYIYQYNNSLRQYNTFVSSFDMHVDALSGGVGLTMLADGDGKSFQNNSIGAIYSYQYSITREFSVRSALKINLSQTRINASSFTGRYDQTNSRMSSLNYTSDVTYAGTGFGLLGYSKRYYFGLSADNINFSNRKLTATSKLKMPFKYSAIAGAMIPLKKGKRSYLAPVVVAEGQGRKYFIDSLNRYLLNRTNYVSLQLNFCKENFSAGLGYRYMFKQNSFYQLQASFTRNAFQFGYSGGISQFKNLSSQNMLASYHQLSVDYSFACRPKHKKFRTVSCPSFGGSGGYYASSYRSCYSGYSSSSSSAASPSPTTTTVKKSAQTLSKSGEVIKPGTLTATWLNDFKKWKLWEELGENELAQFQTQWNLKLKERYSVLVLNTNKQPVTDVAVV